MSCCDWIFALFVLICVILLYFCCTHKHKHKKHRESFSNPDKVYDVVSKEFNATNGTVGYTALKNKLNEITPVDYEDLRQRWRAGTLTKESVTKM